MRHRAATQGLGLLVLLAAEVGLLGSPAEVGDVVAAAARDIDEEVEDILVVAGVLRHEVGLEESFEHLTGRVDGPFVGGVAVDGGAEQGGEVGLEGAHQDAGVYHRQGALGVAAVDGEHRLLAIHGVGGAAGGAVGAAAT